MRVTPLSASGRTYNEGVDLVAVSTDGGSAWKTAAAPGRREWQAMLDTSATPPRWVDPKIPRWVEPIAWDAAGALYSLWTNSDGLWLARSTDRGGAWTSWRIVESGDTLHYPYLVARGRGELAASWFSGSGENLRAHVARIDVDAGGGPPRVSAAGPFAIDAWQRPEKPGDPATRDSAGEYLRSRSSRAARLRWSARFRTAARSGSV